MHYFYINPKFQTSFLCLQSSFPGILQHTNALAHIVPFGKFILFKC